MEKAGVNTSEYPFGIQTLLDTSLFFLNCG